jgi:hypothetical protein
MGKPGLREVRSLSRVAQQVCAELGLASESARVLQCVEQGSFLFFFFFLYLALNSGPTHARQAFYHLSHSTSPLLVMVIFKIGSHKLFVQADVEPQSS